MKKELKVGVLGGAVMLGLLAFLPVPTILLDFYMGLMFAFSAIVALLCVIATAMLEMQGSEKEHEPEISFKGGS